jgi:hypothetical protein
MSVLLRSGVGEAYRLPQTPRPPPPHRRRRQPIRSKRISQKEIGGPVQSSGRIRRAARRRNLYYLPIHRTLSFVSATARSSPAHFRAPGFSFDKHPATSTGVHTWEFDSHEKWNKETSLDIRPSSRTENDGEKENASSKNSQKVEAI